MTNRFDEDPTQAPLDQSNAVPVANPYLTVTQRGLAGLNPDGTPRVSALPAVPDYTGAPGVRNGLSNYAANRPEPLSGEALANFQQWQQQNQPEPAPTQKEYDVMGGLGLIASELNPFGNLGTQLKGAVARTFEEANPEASRSPTGEAGDWQDRWRDEARKADEERRAAAEATGEKYLLPFIQHKDIGGLGSNLGFSAGSMLGTVAAGGAGRLAGGALGSLAGPGGAAIGQQIGGFLGGLAGGGTMAYAQDRQMTLEGAYQKMREEHAKQGKEFTVEDWNKVYNNKDFQEAINDHALWEAGPEAVGNLLFLKLAKMGLTKNLGDSAVKRIAKGAVAFALNQAQEQATETVTQMGQTNAEVAAGMQPEANRRSWSDPSAWAKSWEEIAPQTFLLTSIMGGGTHLAGRAYEKFIQNPRDAESLVTLASDPNIRSALSDTALDNLVLLGEHLSKKVKGNDRIAALAESLKQEQTRRNDDLNYRAQLDQIFGDQTLPDGTTQPGLWTQMEQAKDQPLFGDPLIGTRNKEGKARGDMTVQGLQQLQPILEQGGQTFKTAQQIQAENEWLQGLSDREKADFYANDDARLKNLAQPVTDEYGNQWRFNQNTLQYEPYQLPVSPLTQQQRQAARDAYRQRIGEIAAETQAQQAEIAARTELDDRQKRILQEQADFRARQQMEIEQRKLAQQEASQSVTGGLNEVAPVPQTDSNTIQLQRGQSVELTPPDPSAPVPRSTATAEDEARLRAFMGERPERQPRGLADIPQTPPPPPIKIGNHQVETVTPGALSALEAMREQARKMVSPPQTQPGVTPNAQEVQTQAAPETPVAPLTEPTGNLDAIENTPPSAPDGGSGAQSGVRQEGGRPTEGRQGVQPSGQGREVAAQAKQEEVAHVTPEWMAFPENSGTLNIPRAEMPQIKAEHRGAMVNFLKGQGVSSETQEITADQLKPTQAEFSPKKVQQARDYQGGNRSILVSKDGYIVDGHHQWLAALESQEPVKAIVLDAPVNQLLETVKAFPSAEQAGTPETTPINTQNDQAQSEQPAPAFTPPQGALLIPESALRNPAGYMRARTSKDWGNRFTLNTLEDGKLYAVPKGEEQTQQDIQTTPPLEPSSEQSETQPKQAEQWWSQELTPQGRRNALKAAGIKQGRAPVLWPHLTKNEQQRLDQVRLIQQDTQESLENTHDTNADYSDSETTLEGNVPGSVPIDAGTQRPGERSPSRSDVDVTGDGGTGSGRDDNTGSVASEPGTVGVQEPAPGLDTTGDERDTNIDALWDHLVNQELGEAPAPATKKNRKSRTTSPRAPSAKPKTTGQQVKEKAGHAASELAQAADKATDGLLNLFFTPGKLSANLSIDSDQYERAKPMFLAAAQHLRNAAADIAEILNLIIQDIVRKGRAAGLDNAAIRQGLENIAPYAKQFAKDVGDGVIILDAAETPENPTQPKGAALTGENPGNYRITAEDRLGQGGDSIKVDQNIAAIRLVKQLEAEGRYATRAEQVVLAKYVGWGGLKGAFAPQGDTQSRWNAKLKALVTDGVWTEKEYNSAWESTADAHYTSQPVIEAMYRFLDHLGFSGGRVLEPTVGVGNFIGLMPDTLTEHSQWFASEIDATTSLIAKHLYPDAQIKTATPFEQAEFPYGRFDLAIGNPPFGSLRIRDNKEQRKELDNWKIHNYVIGKSALHLRPGGVMAMVVTHRFLDTMDDSSKQTRDWLDQNMWFLGAIRLPNTAFKKNAGTDVVTDIVFFMRPDSVMDGKVQPVRNWTDIGHIQRDEKRIPVNRYFADNPHLMFGEPSLEGSMYGDKEEFTLKDTGMDIPAAFDAALQADFAELANVLGEVKANQQDAPTFFLENREDIAIGGYLLEGDKLYLRGDNDEFGNANFQELTPNTLWTAKQTLGQKRYDRLKGLLSLRGKAYALINAEQRDAPNIESLRKALRTDYLAFVKEFGPINSPDSNARLLEADPKIEFGLEKNFRKKITPTRAKAMGVAPREESAEMADILLRRLYYPQQKTLYAKDAIDGFSISLSERGKVDLNYIAELTNTSLLEVVNTLSSGDSPRIFRDPDTQAWVEKDEYLSGNVKQKLKKAQDAGLTENIRALEAVLPNDVKVDDIHIEMGAPWVPSEIYNDFLKVLGITQPTVFITSNGQVLFPDARSANVVSNEFNANLRNSDYTLAEMFVALANKQALIAYDEITDSEGNPRRVVNVQRTKELQPLGKSILKMFNDWIRADMDRANLLEKQYNEQINTTVDREFDGNLLRVKDDALIGANPSIKLRPNQKRAAWRMIVSDNVLMDHVVGAGKTITMIAGIMERRRMGLSKKPLIAVPNHLVGQWAKDFLALYPGARLLAASEKDFAPANRKKLMARMATGDYDAIIIGHSMLTKMPVNPEMRTAFVDQEIEFLEQIRAEMEAAKENKRKISGINKRIDSLRQKLQKSINEDLKDQVVFFEETGVDYLVIDESHEFKNLMYHTNMTPVVGMGDPKGSQKAFDLYMKTSSLQRRQGAVTFATGTPISNSLVEMYAILRYLNPQGLKERKLEAFDAWLKTFAGIEEVTEYTATGQLKARNVLTSFSGVPELLQLYRQFADTVTMEDLKRLYSEAVRTRNAATGSQERTEFPIPKVAGGKRQLITVPISPQQRMFVDYLTLRAKKLEGMTGAERKEYATTDNPLWIYSDARKAALDIRVVDPTAMDDAGSKVNRAVSNIKRIYDQTAAVKGTQLVFSDLSTPKKVADKGAKKFISEAFDVLDMKRHPDLVDNVMRAQTYREKWKLLSGTIQGEIEWAGLADMDIYREKLEDFMASVSDDQLSAITTADSGFSVYDDVREKLVQQGIPENQIAFIHEYNSKAEKQELFDRVNAGEVRVLLGSTQKMGAGTNVQARAVVLHHLDAPWRPSDMEQREGRIVRQGNQLYAQDPDGFQIEIYAYSTENTFDAVMWQVLSRKASALEQFRQGKRVVEEVNKDSASYADFMAETTGNPIFREKFELQRKVDELDSAYHRARMQTASAREFLDRVAGRQRLERDRIQDAKTAQAKLPKDTATLAVQQPGEASVTLDADTVIENEKSKYDQEVVQYNNDQRDFLNHIFNLDQFLEKNKQIWQAFLSLYSQTTAHQFSNIRSVLAHIEGYGFDKKVLDELKKGVIPEIQEQNQPSKIPLPDKKPVKPIFPEIGSARINKHTPELNAFRKELLALNENATFTLDVNGIPVEITRTTGKEKRFDVDVNGRQVDWGTTVDRVLNYLRASQLNRLLTQAITLSQRELQRLQDEQVRSEAILRKANLDEMQSNLEAFKARYESIIQQVNAAEAQIAKDRRGQQNIYVERDTARDLSEQEEVPIEEGAGIDIDGTVIPDAPVNQDTTQPSRTLTQAPGVSRETFLNSITTRLPQLNREVLDKLLARGEQRQKGGLVLVESGNLDDITRVFAEKTGRTQDAAVQEIRGGGALSGLYDPHTGLTFAVLPNLSEQSAPAVLLHEAIHSQQRQQIDDAAVRLVNNREQAQPALRKFLNRVVARLEAAGATEDSREYAAYIVEEAVLQGQKNGFNAADGRFLDWVDRALGKPIGDVLRRFVNWIRGTLIQRGILLKTSALTVDDLVQWAQVGVVKQAQGRVKSTPILHQTNKPYERTQIFNIAAQIFFGNEIDTTKMVSASRKDRGRDVRPGRNGAGVSGESSPTGNRIGMVQPGNYLPLIRREVGAVQVDTFQTGIRKVETPEQAASVIAPISYEAQEFLTALVTDAQQKPLAILRHTIGTTSESQAEIAVLAGSVLNVPGAANVWFAHNHPGQKSTQSKDDNDLTDDLDNLLRGSGVYHHGMIVVAANQDASFFDPVTGEETALPKVQMTGKKTKIPVLGRRFVLFEEGDSIFNDTEQKDYLKQFDNTGLLFVDQDYRPVAWLDMSHEEMRQLRKGVTDQGAALLLRIVDRTNAMGALVKVRHASSDVKAVSNITTWLDNAGLVALGVYDAQGHKTIGQRSPSGVFKSVASNPIDYNQLAEDLKQLAQRTELFKFPKLKGKTLDALAAEIDPEIQVSRPDRGKDNPNRAQYKLDWTVDLTMPDGRVATVIKSGDRVMLNAIELNSGTSRGSELYQIVGAFAYQNHLKFSGDTAGISPAGSARRLEHMISLALKYGTTRFLEPHKDQNIPWQEGNDGYNIVQLLKKSVELISNDLPAIRDIRYDFTNKRFVNEKTGSAVSDAWFKALAKSFFPVRDESGNYARSEPAFAGSTTLKRAAIAHTLLQGNGREVRDGLLAWIARQLDSQRLDPGISGLFYSKSPTPAQAGVSASGLKKLFDPMLAVWQRSGIKINSVQSVSDLPSGLQYAIAPTVLGVLQSSVNEISNRSFSKPHSNGNIRNRMPIGDHFNSGVNIPIRSLSVLDLVSNAIQIFKSSEIADTKISGNLFDGNTLISELFDSLPVDRQFEMANIVRSSLHNFEVFRSIISAIPIDMVNNLAGVKISSQLNHSDHAMLQDVFPVKFDISVFNRTVGLTKLLLSSAFDISTRNATEFSVDSHAWGDREINSTNLTNHRYRHDASSRLSFPIIAKNNIEGFYDEKSNEIYLIADNISSFDRAKEVLFHEAVGHWSSQNLRSSAEFLQVLKSLQRLEKVGNRDIKRIAAHVDRTQPNLDSLDRASEIYAVAIEQGLHNKISLLQATTDRLLNILKAAMRKLGFDNAFVNSLTMTDALRFAKETQEKLNKGVQSNERWVFTGDGQIVKSINKGDTQGLAAVNSPRIPFSRTSSPEQARNILDEIGGVISNLEPQKNILERVKNYDELWPALKQGAKDLAAKARPAWLKLLTRQQMVELLQDIPVIGKLATQFEQTARDMDADKSDLKQQAYDIAERWQRLLAKTRDRGLLLSQIMHLSTLEQVNPLEPPKFEDYNDHSSFSRATQVYQRLDGMMKKLRKQNPELADLYPAILKHYELMNALHFDALEARIGRSAVGIFRAMLDRVKETVVKGQPKTLTQALSALQQQDAAAYDALTDALLKRFGDHKMSKADTQALRNTLTPEAQQVFDDVLADVQEKVKRSLSSLSDFKRARSIKGPYFPLGRFGQFEVYAEKAGEALPTYAKFETQAEQIEAVKLLQKDGWTVKTNYQIQQAMQSRVPSDTAIGKMFIAVDENVDDPAAALALKDDLYQLYLESLPDLSVRKHFIHRQGIPGFSQDALRVFAQYMNSKANAIARTRHSDVLTESLAKMESAKKRMGDDPLMNAREQARAAMVISELNSSYQWLMNPSNATWANRLTSFGFLWHLTNPATALVNLTQVPIMTFPDLAAKYGAGRATKMLARTIREYGAWKFSTGAQRQKLQRDLGQEFNGDMQRMLDKLEKSGIISRTQTVALAGMGEHALEAEGSAKSSVGRAYAWAMDKGSWMFQKAEIANREISAIAAYRLARQQAEEKGNSAEDAHSHGVDVAYNVVARTQGDYSNANRAYVMRGNWRRVLFLFRSFSQLMTWRMLRDAYQSFKAASPEEKQEARSRLGWMTTSAFLFGGAAGVPIYSLVVGLVNAMFGADPDDPWDVETEVNQILDGLLGTTGRQAIMTGAVGQLPKLLGMSGVDLSPRVSIDLKHLWIRDMPGDLEGQDAAQWVLNQALGPLVGTGLGFTKAWSQMAQASHDPNALLRGMEGLVPAPLRNALKAARYGTEGVTTRRGDLLIDDADWSMLLTQAVGFTPDQIADQYRINTGVYELKDAIEKRRRALQNRYVYAAESEDQELMDETLEMIGRYNERNPEFPITSNTLSQTYRHWLRARAEHENGIFIPSRGLRARLNRED